MPDLTPCQKAERIVALFRERRPVDVLPAELCPAGLDEAYAVRAAYEAIAAAGPRGPVAGFKIAITTRVMQQLCGIDEPCYGAIFTHEVHHGTARLRAADFCRLGIETEIAVRLGEDLPQGGDRERVSGAVESCMAAIELIEDLRYDYKRITAAALIAGNAWNAGIVLGPPVRDWRRRELGEVAARLAINGREIGAGVGADALGHPLNALAWLANRRAAEGNPLRRGQVVMTGSLVATQFPAAGDDCVVTIDGLGQAELVLS
ncbi:MAG TPA: fumarylacetoacetate hydrolase family protein [Stellaceae bacterium]|nr:fumarylacetoacetate hydrolase family protein [Stellaceae bacterium]